MPNSNLVGEGNSHTTGVVTSSLTVALTGICIVAGVTMDCSNLCRPSLGQGWLLAQFCQESRLCDKVCVRDHNEGWVESPHASL